MSDTTKITFDENAKWPFEKPMWYDREGKPMSTEEWTKRFKDLDYKRVGLDTVGKWSVSTVWLGSDYNFGDFGPPIIFETMVFAEGTYRDHFCERYATEAEARAGHDRVVEALKSGDESFLYTYDPYE